MCGDALESLHECLRQRPPGVSGAGLFWNRKQPHRPLTVKAIQKMLERYAKAAGIKASCHSLRHTFASNLLEEGAEVVSIPELLGHSSIASSERLCTAVESAGEARVLANDAEGDEQESGVGGLSHIQRIGLSGAVSWLRHDEEASALEPVRVRYRSRVIVYITYLLTSYMYNALHQAPHVSQREHSIYFQYYFDILNTLKTLCATLHALRN